MSLSPILDRLCQGETLSQEEARSAMDGIMEGALPATQVAAFLVALRARGETPQEIAGMALSMRQHAAQVSTSREKVIDTCGTGGDKSSTFNISTLSALVAVGAGASVAKHGNRAVSGCFGSADLLEALGVRIDLPADKVGACIDDVGIGFMFAPVMHASMKNVMGTRKELGIRTVFNILGPLTNPAGAKCQVLGVFDPSLVETIANVLKLLGSEKVIVVHGNDGTDEITLTTTTHIATLDNDQITSSGIAPGDFGLTTCASADLVAKDAESSLAMARQVLDNQPGPPRDVVTLNAAAALVVADVAADIGEGIERARDALECGDVKDVLSHWVEVSNKL
jgi:anthranilate phosphoribosyltransferase